MPLEPEQQPLELVLELRLRARLVRRVQLELRARLELLEVRER